jgi:hypothetical protein
MTASEAHDYWYLDAKSLAFRSCHVVMLIIANFLLIA